MTRRADYGSSQDTPATGAQRDCCPGEDTVGTEAAARPRLQHNSAAASTAAQKFSTVADPPDPRQHRVGCGAPVQRPRRSPGVVIPVPRCRREVHIDAAHVKPKQLPSSARHGPHQVSSRQSISKFQSVRIFPSIGF